MPTNTKKGGFQDDGLPRHFGQGPGHAHQGQFCVLMYVDVLIWIGLVGGLID
jgi:hypothetical protein